MDDKIISTLDRLIQTCRDGQEGLKTAAQHIKNDRARAVFEQLARERGELAAELQHEVTRLGATPDSRGSVSGALHRGWMDLRAMVNPADDQVISEAERGEDVAKSTFQSALEEVADPQARAAVRRVYDRIVAAHDHVRALENATSRS